MENSDSDQLDKSPRPSFCKDNRGGEPKNVDVDECSPPATGSCGGFVPNGRFSEAATKLSLTLVSGTLPPADEYAGGGDMPLSESLATWYARRGGVRGGTSLDGPGVELDPASEGTGTGRDGATGRGGRVAVRFSPDVCSWLLLRGASDDAVNDASRWCERELDARDDCDADMSRCNDKVVPPAKIVLLSVLGEYIDRVFCDREAARRALMVAISSSLSPISPSFVAHVGGSPLQLSSTCTLC